MPSILLRIKAKVLKWPMRPLLIWAHFITSLPSTPTTIVPLAHFSQAIQTSGLFLKYAKVFCQLLFPLPADI